MKELYVVRDKAGSVMVSDIYVSDNLVTALRGFDSFVKSVKTKDENFPTKVLQLVYLGKFDIEFCEIQVPERQIIADGENYQDILQDKINQMISSEEE